VCQATVWLATFDLVCQLNSDIPLAIIINASLTHDVSVLISAFNGSRW